MRHLIRAGLGACCAVCAATPLHAEIEADNTIVVTATAATEKARAEVDKTPGGVDVVDASAFADSNAVSLRDVLGFSPGVYLQPRFGQEVRISIRGSGLSRGYHMRGLMLFQDEMPINLADNNGDFQELDPRVFERVEVYRGGNALKLGGSTLGGAIDAVTPTGRTAPGYQLRLEGGSYDTIRALAAAGFATNAADAWLSIATDNSDGDRQHASRSSLRFNGNLGIRISDDVETRFYASVNHIDQNLPGALTRTQALTTPALSLPSNISSDQERDIDSIRLQNRTTATIGAATLTAGAFLNVRQLFHPIYQVIDQQSTDYGLFARVDVETGPLAFTLGSTARYGSIAARQYLNVGGDRGAQTLDSTQKAHTIDTYGEVRLKAAPGLSLIAGGLYTSGWRAIDNRTVPARSGDADYDRFAPKFGLLYEPLANVQFFANYSRSIELPGLGELTQTPANGTPGFVSLAPQRAWTAEFGTRGQIGLAHWDVTFYRADLNGELLQFDVGPSIPASTFNAGKTRHQGIEAGLDLQLARWALLRQSWQLNDFRFRGDAQFADNRLPVIPENLYRAELKLGTEALSVSPNVEWVPKGAWADYANTTRAPGYVLFGIGASAALSDRFSLFVDARNLANRKAIGDISAVTRAAAASVIYYPVERRAVYGGVRARF